LLTVEIADQNKTAGLQAKRFNFSGIQVYLQLKLILITDRRSRSTLCRTTAAKFGNLFDETLALVVTAHCGGVQLISCSLGVGAAVVGFRSDLFAQRLKLVALFFQQTINALMAP